MKRIYWILTILITLVSCEKPLFEESKESSEPEGNAVLRFKASFRATRSAIDLSDYCSKINLMLFDEDGNKAFDKVKTQTKDNDENFETFGLNIPEGTYIVVAVAHSSIKSATIKSPSMVQFTASNGEKLTDTFYYYGEIEVTSEPKVFDLDMDRIASMVRFYFTDETMPEDVVKFKFEYTGGSANFNPSTGQGCTKSSQSEIRLVNQNNIYEVYSFPYMSDTGKLKMNISALDADENILLKRTIEDIYIHINEVTEYSGIFFTEDPNSIQPLTMGFSIDGDWDNIHHFEF